jgi:hypothetical protein
MTVATPPKPSQRSRSNPRQSRPLARSAHRSDCGVLGRYFAPDGRRREVVKRAGHARSVLVIDRDERTLGDPRLVAHLAADEPACNAELVCRHYLSDPRGRWCRPVLAADLMAPGPGASCSRPPVAELASEPPAQVGADIALGVDIACGADIARAAAALVGRGGRAYRLGPVSNRLSIPELRWLALPADGAGGVAEPVSVRDVVASLESYEPVRALTSRTLRRHGDDPAVSVAVLRAELSRMNASRIVLNRGLRRAVLRAVAVQGLSMSEIALRCGRMKYDARGNASGETSWLARRVGISPEGGEREATPWVHSDVLALIARAGLGISPREVELG